MNSNFRKISPDNKKNVHNNVLSLKKLKGENVIFLKNDKTIICHRKI